MTSLNLTIIINNEIETSTDVIFTQVPNLVAPVAVGKVIGVFGITPSTWSGLPVLSGVDAAAFSTNRVNNVLTLLSATILSARTYNLVITLVP